MKKILEYCQEPQSLSDIIHHLGLKSRANVMMVYIRPLIAEGSLTMTDLENPKIRNQKYVTVEFDK